MRIGPPILFLTLAPVNLGNLAARFHYLTSVAQRLLVFIWIWYGTTVDYKMATFSLQRTGFKVTVCALDEFNTCLKLLFVLGHQLQWSVECSAAHSLLTGITIDSAVSPVFVKVRQFLLANAPWSACPRFLCCKHCFKLSLASSTTFTLLYLSDTPACCYHFLQRF